ncbi:carbonic anhydrase family protein [Seonamhaeicola algicola]|uniref:Carbonic anhydrase n=1 Tax=Seonamhaeicola algicola TaxID=1719036 RepID=A0A5C7AT19_9FLAO|nr:carbonic anhydrase family protein [Seonamhaeicola algicola]TXE11850.1 carbonic anhydrase family protein [Seonamhaeicola algicola]
MKTIIKTLVVITLLQITACNNKKDQTTAKHNHEKHWSYAGETAPIHWADIEKNSDCDGNHQSPINIIHKQADAVHGISDLKIHYSPTTYIEKVENNGHSVQFNFEAGDSIHYKNDIYYLKQIHFHEPSEHKINGVMYPIEIHLVHVNKTGQITVLGILGEEGDESQLFEFLESFLPLKNGETKNIHQQLDLKDLFKHSNEYYTYGGSLTTPPCTENVNWVVFKHPIILSVEEVLKLKNNMPVNNYRNEQALNNRIVNYNY